MAVALSSATFVVFVIVKFLKQFDDASSLHRRARQQRYCDQHGRQRGLAGQRAVYLRGNPAVRIAELGWFDAKWSPAYRFAYVQI